MNKKAQCQATKDRMVKDVIARNPEAVLYRAEQHLNNDVDKINNKFGK